MVFDGPADTNWVENFNTILDDSKMLCNSNGQRIKLPNNIIFFFELMDLEMTTPATITRCGVLFIDNNVLLWTNLHKKLSQDFIDRNFGELIGMQQYASRIKHYFLETMMKLEKFY